MTKITMMVWSLIPDWRAAVYGVAKSRTWQNDWTELNWQLTQLNLEIIILTEVSQMKTTIIWYHFVCGIYKKKNVLQMYSYTKQK